MTSGPPSLNAFVRQRGAAEDLRVVSWGNDKVLAAVKGYLYNVDWRQSPTIYVIDTGVDPRSGVSIQFI